jgi:hypothetical protein
MQKLKVKIHKRAYLDIKEAAEWYDQRSAGLGERFKVKVIEQIDFLSHGAFQHTIRYDDVRCFKIDKFPFNIHYIVNMNEVHVFAVIHTSRNPEIWRSRKP